MEHPTFYHQTVLLKEAVDGLAINPDGVYVDATFGGGGHSREILSRLGENGKLVAFDQDQDAWQNQIEDKRLTPVTENFRYLRRFLKLHNVLPVDGILADLGVSSHQFDTPERGFSIRYDGPLDMRMDARTEKTAADILRDFTEQQLHQILEKYGEVRNARQLARHIVTHRKTTPVQTIQSLKTLIAPIIRGNAQRYLAQVFQALRIEVNGELDALEDFLEQTTMCVRQGGRLSVITFHSLEDRIVKRFFRRAANAQPEDQLRGTLPAQLNWKEITKKPVEPGEEEQKKNPRARSARLRIAEKL